MSLLLLNISENLNKENCMNLGLRHRIILEIIINALLLVFYSVLYLNADSLIEQSLFGSLDASFFPKIIILCIAIMSLMLLIDTFIMWNNYKKNKITHQMKELIANSEDYPMVRVFIYIGTLFLYLIGFYYIGFFYSTPIIVVLVAYLLGMKNILIGVVAAIVFTLALDYASLHFLQILLPSGILFE